MAYHNQLGKEGEIKARSYLETKGYSIKDQNWKFGKKEVDIVAYKNQTVVIVEVKTRSKSTNKIDEIISPAKESHLIEAANAYMESQPENYDCRIDLILLHKKEDNFEVIHIENAISQA